MSSDDDIVRHFKNQLINKLENGLAVIGIISLGYVDNLPSVVRKSTIASAARTDASVSVISNA